MVSPVNVCVHFEKETANYPTGCSFFPPSPRTLENLPAAEARGWLTQVCDLPLIPTALVLISYSRMTFRSLNHSFLFIYVLINLFIIEHLLDARHQLGHGKCKLQCWYIIIWTFCRDQEQDFCLLHFTTRLDHCLPHKKHPFVSFHL